jgi:ABC-2 type transport system ATP-binding protein
MTNDAVIQTQALTKTYGDAEAVRRLNLSVGRNRITAFLGRNGAGKSTTIKMLLGMIRPTAGSGTVLGKQIANTGENREMRQRVAYVAEDKPLYGYMTVEQTIRFFSSFYPTAAGMLKESFYMTTSYRYIGKSKCFPRGCEPNLPYC